MAYSPINDSELDAGDPLSVALMRKFRDNAKVGKAPRGRVFTSSTTFTVPDDCEAIVATVIGGGGDNDGDHSGGRGGAVKVWATVSSGQSLSVNVGAAGGNSRITGIARARAGGDADDSADEDGAVGAIDDLQSGASYIIFENTFFLNVDGDAHGAAEVPGLVVIEY